MELVKEKKVALIFEKGNDTYKKEVGLKVASQKIKTLFIEKLSEISKTEKDAKLNDIIGESLQGMDLSNLDEEAFNAQSQKAVFDAMKSGKISIKEMFATASKETILKQDEIYLDLFKIILDEKNLTTEEKEQCKEEMFWLNQDTELIGETVDSFRSRFKLETY